MNSPPPATPDEQHAHVHDKHHQQQQEDGDVDPRKAFLCNVACVVLRIDAGQEDVLAPLRSSDPAVSSFLDTVRERGDGLEGWDDPCIGLKPLTSCGRRQGDTTFLYAQLPNSSDGDGGGGDGGDGDDGAGGSGRITLSNSLVTNDEFSLAGSRGIAFMKIGSDVIQVKTKAFSLSVHRWIGGFTEHSQGPRQSTFAISIHHFCFLLAPRCLTKYQEESMEFQVLFATLGESTVATAFSLIKGVLVPVLSKTRQHAHLSGRANDILMSLQCGGALQKQSSDVLEKVGCGNLREREKHGQFNKLCVCACRSRRKSCRSCFYPFHLVDLLFLPQICRKFKNPSRTNLH